MPRWHKVVLVLAALAAGAGAVGQFFAEPAMPTHHVSNVNPDNLPPNARGAIDTGSAGRTTAAEKQEPTGAAPATTRIGLSVIVGFILGWLSRAFLKIMSLAAVVIAGVIWALNHFGVVDIGGLQVSSIEKESQSLMNWLSTQGSQIKDFVVAHLPSTGGGLFGAFLGFRR